MPDIINPAVVTPERTLPKPLMIAGLIVAGALIGVGLSAKLLPVRKVLYPVEGPPKPCDECERKRQAKEAEKAAVVPVERPADVPQASVASDATPS
jgi:hypothetical protein